MDIKAKNNLYWIVGIALIAGFIYYKRKKSKAEVKQNFTPALAQEYYNKIQALYASVPQGFALSKPVMDKVVAYEMELEDNGYTVENNKLVKL